MNKDAQGQSGGFSESEKGMLIRAAFIGFIASLGTLWLGDVFDANGPSLLSLTVILACLFSLLATVLISVMGESVIEDVIKLLIFALLWWFTRQYDAVALITLGLMVGGTAGLLNNRIEIRDKSNKR